MARVAVVTGGTRGSAPQYPEALKEAGYKVAANYAGNDEAAAPSQTIPASPSSSGTCRIRACAEPALKAVVEAELGPVDVLVNNAGITRDGIFHKMTPDQWSQVIRHQSEFAVQHAASGIEGMRDRGFGRIVLISSVNGQKGQLGTNQLFGRESRRDRLRQGAGAGKRQQGDHRQRDLPRLHRHRDGAGGAGGGSQTKDPPASFLWAGSASRKRSPARSFSSPPTMPASSPVRR